MATGLRINYPQHYESHQMTSSIQNNAISTGINTSINSMNDAYAMPLFQRIGHQDYAEIQNCHAIIESLQQRVQHLEGINLNLEHRLEKEAKTNIQLEKDMQITEQTWKLKCSKLEDTITTLNHDCATEKLKNERLREHLSRTERELYSILQRKYELMRGGGSSNTQGPAGVTGLNGVRKGDMRTGSPQWETKPEESADDIYGTQQVSYLKFD